jgi:hypothetical protein
MLLAALIAYLLPGLVLGSINYLVEEGDPGNESAHWVVIFRSIGIGLVWLPYTLVAAYPRKDRVLRPKHDAHWHTGGTRQHFV